MGSVNNAGNMNAGVIYCPFIPLQNLETKPEDAYRFKISVRVLAFKMEERVIGEGYRGSS